ncbi:MAG TPA: hypothetical protein VN419_01970 [Humidesulfovibrio sp.]|uniref:hypothetical protein n=1 Tax=Humidesulfovibrio sp. TaxID=2910988 RepID=UPI002CDDBA1F|nr:hypothetical protein [Humidesulfovibrio sp.]HWR02759.1 hypothetical protein [Humidesulfovibrio sp.]
MKKTFTRQSAKASAKKADALRKSRVTVPSLANSERAPQSGPPLPGPLSDKALRRDAPKPPAAEVYLYAEYL